MWHIEPLFGNDHNTIYTMAITTQYITVLGPLLTSQHTLAEVLLEAAFCMRLVERRSRSRV
jgi:hypothetical protein